MLTLLRQISQLMLQGPHVIHGRCDAPALYRCSSYHPVVIRPVEDKLTCFDLETTLSQYPRSSPREALQRKGPGQCDVINVPCVFQARRSSQSVNSNINSPHYLVGQCRACGCAQRKRVISRGKGREYMRYVGAATLVPTEELINPRAVDARVEVPDVHLRGVRRTSVHCCIVFDCTSFDPAKGDRGRTQSDEHVIKYSALNPLKWARSFNQQTSFALNLALERAIERWSSIGECQQDVRGNI
jgi:hypothetical protein